MNLSSTWKYFYITLSFCDKTNPTTMNIKLNHDKRDYRDVVIPDDPLEKFLKSQEDRDLAQKCVPRKIRKRASPFSVSPEKPIKKVKIENLDETAEVQLEHVEIDQIKRIIGKMDNSLDKARLGLKMMTKHLGEVYKFLGELKQVVGK